MVGTILGYCRTLPLVFLLLFSCTSQNNLQQPSNCHRTAKAADENTINMSELIGSYERNITLYGEPETLRIHLGHVFELDQTYGGERMVWWKGSIQVLDDRLCFSSKQSSDMTPYEFELCVINWRDKVYLVPPQLKDVFLVDVKGDFPVPFAYKSEFSWKPMNGTDTAEPMRLFVTSTEGN